MECKHFGECGSCSIYNISYEDELKDKKLRVLSLLSPFGVEELELFSCSDSNYRARAEFRVWHHNDRVDYAMGRLNRRGAITISDCPKVILPIYNTLSTLLSNINNSSILKERLFSIEFLASTIGDILVTMIYHKRLDNIWLEEAKELEDKLNISILGRSRKQKVILSRDFIVEKLFIDNQEYLYRHYEGGFTQPNPAINIKMINWAIVQAKSISYGDFLESYCGLGNFTIPLSKYFNRVLATEISKRSIQSAKENAYLNNIKNIEFVRLSSEEMTEALNGKRVFRRLKDINLNSYNFSTVLVDPPRAGLDSATIELISNIDNIIYISCNPETLARDLKILTKTHKIKSTAIFDQFPHTPHIESGVFLVKI